MMPEAFPAPIHPGSAGQVPWDGGMELRTSYSKCPLQSEGRWGTANVPWSSSKCEHRVSRAPRRAAAPTDRCPAVAHERTG